jgi:hypothetical protein
LVVFAEKELILWHGNDRAQGEQEFEDIGSDSTKNWHALQKCESCFNAAIHLRQVALLFSRMRERPD